MYEAGGRQFVFEIRAILPEIKAESGFVHESRLISDRNHYDVRLDLSYLITYASIPLY